MTAVATSGVIITGGASGIGLATAAALVREGRPVAIWDLGSERIEAAVESLSGGTPVFGAVVDVTDHERVAAATAESRAALGSIGGLVHSAGNIISEPIGEIDWSHWSSQIDTHLNAYARIVQEVLPHLRECEDAAVVAISSINGLIAEA
ncbi:MAG TPA: SDR family oxidoreductase, partial [Marmoricola sp.]|nr:SDR family oxidoreductase [Marmoricola sp.]